VISRRQIVEEFRRSRAGMAGAGILVILIAMSIYAAIAIPLESFRQWNNPNYWVDYPRSAAPAWTNVGILGPKAPQHLILSYPNDASVSRSSLNGINLVTHTYTIDFDYDSYPSDFTLPYDVKYGSTPPILQVDVSRPDGKTFRIYYFSLPPSQSTGGNEASARVFSSDPKVSENLRNYYGDFKYQQDASRPEIMIFSDLQHSAVLKGKYMFKETFYLFGNSDAVEKSGVVLGGKVYGLMGTDESRRDLAIGLLWGAPVALFIGLTVSIASVLIGLVYGVIAGYKGKRTDEGLMRINDVFYSLPTLPLLVIMSVAIGRSIFLITGFLVIFGWVGMAKISRSLALQIKNLQYVEAAKLMGQSDIRIIFKHIIPQLLPLTFASIAISVPAAILGEAGLSFVGLGDPSIPTWGQILHDANSAGAAASGVWWWVAPPGFMIAITGLAFVLIGNALDSIVNPRSKKT
jgi:peptide/nickel transport system permease protein